MMALAVRPWASASASSSASAGTRVLLRTATRDHDQSGRVVPTKNVDRAANATRRTDLFSTSATFCYSNQTLSASVRFLPNRSLSWPIRSDSLPCGEQCQASGREGERPNSVRLGLRVQP